MKYAVIGATFAGNKGAASMLVSSIQNLTDLDPEATFAHLTVYPTADREQNTDSRVTVLDANPIRLGVIINGGALLHRLLPPLRTRIEDSIPEVKAIRQADVLIDEGGITFVDGRARFLIYNVATVLPAFFLKTPVVKAAQALGPFDTVINKICSRLVLPRIRRIVARGDVTQRFLRSLNLKNVERGADLAFAMRVGQDARNSLASRLDLSFFDDHNVVGYAPSQVLAKSSEKSGIDYLGDTARALDVLVEAGKPVALIAHSARHDTDKLHNNDLPVCRSVYSRLRHPEKVLFIDYEVSAEELRYLISLCHTFVTSRFHGMVSALSTGVPPVVIGWSHKYAEVLDDFGLASLSMPLEESSPERTLELVNQAEDQYGEISATINREYVKVRELSLEQFRTITDIAARG